MAKRIGNSGFTLLELMVVVAIIGISAAVTTFSIGVMLPDLQLKAANRELISDMNMARLRAIRENSRVVMTFDTVGNRYTIFIDDGAGGGVAGNNTPDGAETMIKEVDLPPRVTMLSAAFGPVARVRFNGLGLPAAAGNVRMRNTQEKYLGIYMSMIGRVRVSNSNDGGSSWT